MVSWEVGRIGGAVCLFSMLLLATAILTTAVRYKLLADNAGILLLTYHFIIHSLWIYVMTLSVNLLAIYLGSSSAYAWVISVQLVCIVLLNLIDLLVRYCDSRLTYENAVIWNPIAHLVLGWHGSSLKGVNQVLTSSDIRMDLNGSLILFFLLGLILTSVGAFVIKNMIYWFQIWKRGYRLMELAVNGINKTIRKKAILSNVSLCLKAETYMALLAGTVPGRQCCSGHCQDS